MGWSWSGSSMMDLRASKASMVTFRLPTTSLLSATSTTGTREEREDKALVLQWMTDTGKQKGEQCCINS